MRLKSQLQIGEDTRVELQIPPSPNEKLTTSRVGYTYLKFNIMTDKEFKQIINNQIILDNKLDRILNELKIIRQDVSISIDNQRLLEGYEIDVRKRLVSIESKLK